MREAVALRGARPTRCPSLPPDLLGRAAAVVADRLGLHFPEHRYADLARGLELACEDCTIEVLTGFVGRLEAAPEHHRDWRRMARSLTVGETYFFREPNTLESLEREALVPLIASRRAAGNLRLRLWSAACASGEEAYTLAIMLDRLLPDRADWDVTILATDVSSRALERARAAVYTPQSFRRTPDAVRERCFDRRGAARFELDERVRAMVSFAELNLASDTYPSLATNTTAMDVILCRNVLIYLTPEAQRATVQRLGRCLQKGGWLAVSPVEASPREMFEPLVPVSLPGALLFRRLARGAAPRRVAREPLPRLDPAPAPAAPAPLPPPPVASAPVAHEEAPSMLEEARALADRGALEEARGLCETELARDPLEVRARILLALVHQERGDLAAMIEALRAAIYVAPDSVPAHFLMGCALCNQGRLAEGRRALDAAVELLGSLPDDTVLEEWEGLTAGRLRATARRYGGQR